MIQNVTPFDTVPKTKVNKTKTKTRLIKNRKKPLSIALLLTPFTVIYDGTKTGDKIDAQFLSYGRVHADIK